MKIKNTTTCINCRKSYSEEPEEANGYGTCHICEQKIIDRIMNLPRTSVKKRNDFVPQNLARKIRRYFVTYYGTLFVTRDHARRLLNKQLGLSLTKDRFDALTTKGLLKKDGLKLRDDLED